MATLTAPTTMRTLSPEEVPVRKLLGGAAQLTDGDKPQNDLLVSLFTAGWVGDNLLGTRNVDIDVGIKNISGSDFATSSPGTSAPTSRNAAWNRAV